MLIYGYNALATVGSGYLVLRLKASGVVKLLPLCSHMATFVCSGFCGSNPKFAPANQCNHAVTMGFSGQLWLIFCVLATHCVLWLGNTERAQASPGNPFSVVV